MVVSSPTTAAVYLFGMSLSELVFQIPSVVIILILASVYIHASVLAAAEVFAVLMLLYAFSIVFGFFLSTFSSDILQSWSFTGILSILLTTIPPVYYPITYIPMPWRYIAYISPTTYAAGIVQNALGYLHSSPMEIAVDWIVVLVLSALLFVVAVKKNRWREV